MDTNEQWAAALAEMRASIKQQLAQELAQEFNAALGKFTKRTQILLKNLKKRANKVLKKFPKPPQANRN
jgi:HD-GYP domain-containing protein (c-di-GMP phosphodiesterase class II)